MNNKSPIAASYQNIIGQAPQRNAGNAGNAGNSTSQQIKALGKTHQGVENLFSYQGTKYNDLPSYKAGSGGGQSLDRLAQMMGGQIYNPYQFSRMTSAGSKGGALPFESTLSSQEAAQQSSLERQRAGQEKELMSQKFKLESQAQKQNQIYSLQSQLRGVRQGSPAWSSINRQIRNLQREINE